MLSEIKVTSEANASLADLRQRIVAATDLEEEIVVQALMREAQLEPAALKQAQTLAARLAEGVREARIGAAGVDLLTQEFSLDSREGIALMCLAEAMLRIPDTDTRNRLIRDKIVDGDWRSHVGNSPSLFVNATAWGLFITGKLLKQPEDSALAEALSRVLRKGGETVVRAGVAYAMGMLGKQFVTGQTIEEAIGVAKGREARGYCYSYDMLGEAALTQEDAQAYFEAYWHAIEEIGKTAKGVGPIAGPGVSVKLTGLHPRYELSQRQRVISELYPQLLKLACAAKQWKIGFHLDQEEASRFDLTLEMLERLARAPELQGWDGLGISLQAYQKRGRSVVDWVIALARANRRRILVRLVKGAYWDTEIKRCQAEGTKGYPVFTRKVHSDVSYIACAKALLAAQDAIFPQFATHNAFTIAAVHTLAGNKDYEFQCLHGMGETVYDQVVGEGKLGRPCRIYAPVGPHATLLAYLVRRLLENGANTSFVSQIVDPTISIADIIEDPVARAARTSGKPHPQIVMPPALLPGRKNAAALGFAGSADFSAALAELRTNRIFAEPVLGNGRREPGEAATLVPNPGDLTEIVGSLSACRPDAIAEAIKIASSSGREWGQCSFAERANKVGAAADLFEKNAVRLGAILVLENGKTLPDAAEEVRQAIDLCRLYAYQVQSEIGLHEAEPIGVVVAISPVSSPLFTFVGQLAGALVTGNAVLAKPSSSASLVAYEVVRLFHQAGIPLAALQFLPGTGHSVGNALVRDHRVSAVLFSGSPEVAQEINATLAALPIAPVFVAATGGFNSMIVDSSALPEQVISDAIASAFDSSGQRASSLRLLCLQDSTAENVLGMLKGMLRERSVGNPVDVATDIGPVSTQKTQDGVEAYIAKMASKGFPVFRAKLRADIKNGRFVAPTIIDVGNFERIEEIDHDVIGPVLHVVRWKSGQLDQLLRLLNARAGILVQGLHTRINETAGKVLSVTCADTVYINRVMHATAVGMQPHGGVGLAGTGPKVAGPLALSRLVKQSTVSWGDDKGPFARAALCSSEKFYENPVITRDGKAVSRFEHERRTIEERQSLLLAMQEVLAEYGAIGAEGKRRIARNADKLRNLVGRSRVLSLPALTGEENTVELLPKGQVLCLGRSDESVVQQVMVAAGLGNDVLLPRSPIAEALLRVLGDARCKLVDGGNPFGPLEETVSGMAPKVILTDAGGAELVALRSRAASARAGVPFVLAPDSEGVYDWTYLVRERTTSINASAAGGNTQLMVLNEELM